VKSAKRRIGIDLGGTKIALAIFESDLNGADGTVRSRKVYEQRVPTPSGDYQATIAAICSLVKQAEDEQGECDSIGIGTPGSCSPSTGLMRNCNSTCLNNMPFQDDLSAALDRPIRMANDADCFALSEAIDGAAVGKSTVFGVILGTGTGGGIVVNGKLLDGPNRIAGEWGHNPCLHPLAEPLACYCGRKQCIETQLSGPSFERRYRQRSGAPLSAKQISVLCEQGEEHALAVFDEYTDMLAWSLAQVVNVLDPDAIVLGGGLSSIQALYPALQKKMPAYVFSDCFNTPILPPVYGDASGVRGAAWLWP